MSLRKSLIEVLWICKKFTFLQNVTQKLFVIATVRGLKSNKDKTEHKEEEPKYQENEVNGKFKIMSKWDEDLKDRESPKFKKLEATIKEGLLEMLRGDENLKDQADFEIDIISFR